MPVTFTNNTTTPIGLWDTSPEYHVVGMGQSVTIEPDAISAEVIKIYADSGSGTVTDLEAPENTGAPTISGDAVVGETVTSTTGNWTGNPAPDYTRQWQRSSNGTSGWSNISGETGTSYDLDEADEDQYVRVQVTATNSEGSNTASSAALGPIDADEG